METSFYVIEFGCYAFYLWCLLHAWQRGARWFTTLIAATLFGLAVELSFLYFERDGPGYTYSDRFLIMLGWSAYKVPLWVGTGWASIVYASIWTASRLDIPLLAKGVVAGLLAFNLDIGLDPLAEVVGFWSWHDVPPTNYFGVPFDNFLGWFMIVGSYALSIFWLFARVPERWQPSYWAPVAACVPALLMTAAGQLVLNRAYALFDEQVVPFIAVIGSAVGVAGYFSRSVRHDLAPDRCVLTLPVYFHALYFAILMISGQYRSHGAFVMVIPLGLFLAFIAFAWSSFDRVFGPRS